MIISDHLGQLVLAAVRLWVDHIFRMICGDCDDGCNFEGSWLDWKSVGQTTEQRGNGSYEACVNKPFVVGSLGRGTENGLSWGNCV